MKRIMLGLTFLTAPGLAYADAYDTAITSTPGLLGYYPFTAASQGNSTVNGYTGVLENGAVISPLGAGPPIASDPKSTALQLAQGTGGTKYMISGGSKPLQGGINGSGSIVTWINLATLPSTTGRIYSIAGESQVGNDFDLQVNANNLLSFYTDGGSATVDPTPVKTGAWVQVAATFTAGSDRTLYVDGVEVATSTPGGHSANTSPFYVGESNVFTGRYFDGLIGDTAVYGTDLTAAQVAAIYAAADAPGTSPTGPTPVPEPASLALLAAALLGTSLLRQQRR